MCRGEGEDKGSSKKMERELGSPTQRSGTAQRWLNTDRTSAIRQWKKPGSHRERRKLPTSSLVDPMTPLPGVGYLERGHVHRVQKATVGYGPKWSNYVPLYTNGQILERSSWLVDVILLTRHRNQSEPGTPAHLTRRSDRISSHAGRLPKGEGIKG